MSQLTILTGWLIITLVSLLVYLVDLKKQSFGMMKYVWFLTILYSGVLGLIVYWYSGRKQITSDTLWKRGFRSVSHCYSGCGAGEVIGVIIAGGILALDNIVVAAFSFSLAFLIGYLFTVGPLLQEGVGLTEAIRHAFYTETISIFTMEVVAISADILIAGGVSITTPFFWIGLIISLSLGFIAAYPVNILLLSFGIKSGMGSP